MDENLGVAAVPLLDVDIKDGSLCVSDSRNEVCLLLALVHNDTNRISGNPHELL